MIDIVPPKVAAVLCAVRDRGGAPYLVGGAVRDALLDTEAPIKDFDFEVYHLTIDALIDTLSGFGNVETVGRSFGVIKLFMGSGADLDFALPRRESKTGRGHRGFVVSADPNMPKEDACARRDFTINACLMDPFTGGVIDFFNGRQDLEHRVLRHTSGHFVEDPLRPLRGMQFAARFDMSVHDDTCALCRTLVPEAESLATERIFGEWEKWALLAPLPSRGLEALVAMGWDRVFSELGNLRKKAAIWQDTLAAVDRAAAFAHETFLDRGDRLLLLLGALVHGLRVEARDAFLRRIGVPGQTVTRLAPLHVGHARIRNRRDIAPAEVRRLSVDIKPATLRVLTALLTCTSPESPILRILPRIARDLELLDGPPKPLLTGKHLVARGIRPGRFLGDLLKTAFERQLNGDIATLEDALSWLDRFLAEQGDSP
jgi:tRNA nucleotidyltransferase (CCA-adding enzyme)